MGNMSMKGVIDMHVHTNPDLRLRAYDDFQLSAGDCRIILWEELHFRGSSHLFCIKTPRLPAPGTLRFQRPG